MPKLSSIFHYLFHPEQLRAIIQWKLYHDPIHEREPEKETATLRRCYEFLDLTSRSFSAVIQELNPEMRVPVSLFYLILRGLDTVEDDMTIPIDVKEPILRSFHEILDDKTWTFDKCGPKERDRQLLVEFTCVTEEFGKIPDIYREVIKDITMKMGNGMADYARLPEFALNGVKTIEDYDRYCWYVAGLVGEGLTRLFVPAKVANPALMERPNLHSAMGLFLQKTNIIRDYAEDLRDSRSFWPREIWSKHVEEYTDLAKPENKEAALNCNSEMILNAINHITECLFYLAGIKEQSVFNFCAIPQVMAIATLSLIYRNHDIYFKNVKIPKGEACMLMLETGNLRSVCAIFRKYLKVIHKKSTPKDPNYLNVSIAIGRVEQFIESIFPSEEAQLLEKKREMEVAAKRAEETPTKGEMTLLITVSLATIVFMTAIMMGVAWLMGARFDLAFKEVGTQFALLGINIPFLTPDNATNVQTATEAIKEAVTSVASHVEL